MFIELSEGISVATSDIKRVESTPTGCLVFTSLGQDSTAFPYRLFIQLIEREEEVAPQVVKLEPKAQNALDSLGHHFAG